MISFVKFILLAKVVTLGTTDRTSGPENIYYTNNSHQKYIISIKFNVFDSRETVKLLKTFTNRTNMFDRTSILKS